MGLGNHVGGTSICPRQGELLGDHSKALEVRGWQHWNFKDALQCLITWQWFNRDLRSSWSTNRKCYHSQRNHRRAAPMTGSARNRVRYHLISAVDIAQRQRGSYYHPRVFTLHCKKYPHIHDGYFVQGFPYFYGPGFDMRIKRIRNRSVKITENSPQNIRDTRIFLKCAKRPVLKLLLTMLLLLPLLSSSS